MATNNITNNGGTFNAENIAQGDNVSIHNQNAINNDVKDIVASLDLLMAHLSAPGVDIPEHEDMKASVTMLKEEVQKKEPNKLTLKGVGKMVLENLKYVKDLAPLAEGLWRHIEAFVK
jgi:hypothetical protein